MEQHFDIIIAGAGISGSLAAARLADLNPNLKILLLEKDLSPGGRLRSSGASSAPTTSTPTGSNGTASASLTGEGPSPAPVKRRSHGFNGVSPQLFDFVSQAIKSDPESTLDLATFIPGRQITVGILSGSSVTDVPMDALFTAKGARTFGGMAAGKQWDEVTKILSPDRPEKAERPDKADRTGKPEVRDTSAHSDSSESGDDAEEEKHQSANHPFSSLWKMPRQSPATVVLGHYAALLGIPDLWSATPRAIKERAQYHTAKLHYGKWDEALESLLNRAISRGQVTLETGARIVYAELEKVTMEPSNKASPEAGPAASPAAGTGTGPAARSEAGAEKSQWVVDTSKGSFTGDALLVAMPPWLATPWLPKIHWPTALLTLVSKTKPVSAVVLTETINEKSGHKLPDVLLVPVEGVQVYVTNQTEISFQVTIDFEISHQAPEVVKAVKRLKRARRKILAAYPDVCSQDDRIALIPVGWAQSPTSSETRHIDRLGKQALNKDHLAFCGDAYGASYDGDANIIKSIVAACETLAK